MNISVVNHKSLDSIDGGTTRVRSIVQGLANHGHRVWYSCYGEDNQTSRGPNFSAVTIRKPDLSVLRRLARHAYGGVEGEAAVNILACNHPIAALRLRSILSTSNVVQIEQIWSALYPLLCAKVLGKTCLLDDHNVEALFAARLYHHVSNKRLFAAWVTYVSMLERACCALADTIVVTSELDKQNLCKMQSVTEKKVRVIPNGTNLAKYKPDPTLALVTRRSLGLSSDDPVLTFVGRSSYPPNKLALDYIKNDLCPAVWEKHPRARFLIVSRELPSEFLDRADPRLIAVSDTADYPYINAANLCLAPLSVGGGTRIKILNYMACAKTVVSTPIGIEGISASQDREVIITPLESFANQVNNLLDDPAKLEGIGRGAREFVERGHSWEDSIAMFEGLYAQLIARNGE
jgi:glycosyltransferase involved in cell wall biosynthesis